MAGFGDTTTTFQRTGTVAAGGLKIEAGCWTQLTDASFNVPTQLVEVISVVTDIDGTVAITTIPDVSSGGNIKATLSGSGSGKIVNYTAIGW
jgi:hypothetical protein